MDKPNRAERRKNRFGGGRATEHGGWPTHQPNPVFTGDAPAADAPPEKLAKADDASDDAEPEKGESTKA